MESNNTSFLWQFRLLLVLGWTFAMSGCTYFGLYTKGQVREIAKAHHERGVDEGRAHEIRAAEHARQEDLAHQPPQPRYYRVYVPSYINEDGVKIEGHYVPIQILSEAGQ